MANLSRYLRRDLFTIEPNWTRCGRKGPCNHIEEGGLSGSIGSDQAQDLTSLKGEWDIVKCPQTTEILSNLFDLDDIHRTDFLQNFLGSEDFYSR